jgi:1-pyrroline-5-carboxylate dehydrogenase
MSTLAERTITDFFNEPIVSFSDPEHRAKMAEAIELVRGQLGRKYPLVINGRRIEKDEMIASSNPADPDEIVGYFSKADEQDAITAIESAYQVFQKWQYESPQRRAQILFDAAAIMRKRAYELSAWMVFEVGKNWTEAYADTAEAIDFLEFYGREMLRLAEEQPLTKIPGEDNHLYYIALGVGVVIPPWNFPCAIMAGMTTAAMVAGNTVVLKPASQSPTIAYKFFEILEEAGMPSGVVNFVPGPGGSVGETMVAHPKTRFIAFTGSKEVGLRIHELSAKTQPGQIWIKRTILEMGGKDSIVVDETADLDAAAEGIVAAAYGFQGQKCSACSRAIIVDSVYDEMLQKVVERTKKITVGPTDNPENFMGPVIDKSAYASIMEYIEIGKKEGRLVTGGGRALDKGYFIEPTIFADVDPMARISQEEIFGPVLAFFRARDYNHAIEIANNTEFGLTGALYSRKRERLEDARVRFHCGNLYLNRKCTGALVGVHPFGGFNMSGTDSKAGGRDYLLLFTQAKLVSEKI